MMSCGEQSINMGFNLEVIHSGTISTSAQKLNNLDSIKAWSDPNPYQILPIIWKNKAEKKLCHSHFGDEGPDFAEGLAEDPGVLLPVDVQVVGEAWNEQKEREWSGEWEGGRW